MFSEIDRCFWRSSTQKFRTTTMVSVLPIVRPNFGFGFGFGFGADRVDFNTFGILSVSTESSRDTFGNISASAAVTPNFGVH